LNLFLTISFDFNYLPVLIVVAVAWAIPMLMSLFGIKLIPSVILEIIAGYIIGQTILTGIPGEGIRSLEFLALSGFLFLMFQSGLEVDLSKLFDTFPRGRITLSRMLINPLLAGSIMFIITIILSYFFSWSLSSIVNINNHWYFSLILVTSSVGIILPVLKNRREIGTNYGQMILIAAAIADLLSILLFTFSAFIIRHGFRYDILLILLLFLIFLIFQRTGTRIIKNNLFRRLIYQLAHATSQIKIRGTILLILIFVAAAQFMGEEVMVLGAFLSGLLLSYFINKKRSVLLIQLEGMGYGFFIPIFFIMVGAQFNPAALKEFDNSLYLFLFLLVIILYLVKIIPALLWAKMFGRRQAISGGILMSSRLSLIIAASKIGVDLDIISPGINAVFIIMAVITCIFSPALFNYINPRNELKGEKTIIIGGSSTGVLLARRLRMYSMTSVIVEKNLKRYLELKAKGFEAKLGDGINEKVLQKLEINPGDHVIVLTGHDELNLKICQMLREVLGHDKIISKADQSRLEQKLSNMEVETLDIRRIAASTIENYMLRPATYEALIETFENYSIEETKVTSEAIAGNQIKDISFHKDAYLMLIRRGDKMQVPHGDTFLRKGDIAIVFGTDTAIMDIKNMLGNV